MIFRSTNIMGAFVIEPERLVDDRGFFARVWSQQEFAERGMNASWVQSSISFNRQKHTLRGMHFQAPPDEENKLVRCTRGAMYDVILDLRAGSVSFGKWQAFELTAENRHAVYIPEGVAHGFMTLADQTEVFYEISCAYRSEAACGVRWDDPAFGIEWPAKPVVISDRDAMFASWRVQHACTSVGGIA